MSRFSSKGVLPVFMILGLSACQNYIIKPSALPSGYTYYEDKYKSPPSPEASDIGYAYNADQNEQVLDGMRIKAEELFGQLEENYDMDGVNFYIYSTQRQNAQNAAFDHALREVVRARGYMLSTNPVGAIGLAYSIQEPEDLEKDINFGDMNEDHRETAHYKRIETYEKMILVLELVEGQEVLGSASAVYDMPMYGYDRDNNSARIIKPVAGEAPPKAGFNY